MTALRLNLRTRAETAPGSGDWREAIQIRELPARETALLLCDVWNDHWCRSAAQRCDALAPRIARTVEAARGQGVQIVHAPSDCMAFYEGAPQRRRLQEVPRVEPPQTGSA